MSQLKALKEAFEKAERNYKMYDNYRVDYNWIPLAGKFYSAHDKYDLSQANESLVQDIIKHRDKGPKLRQEWPETTNQEYGWFLDPLVDEDRSDERFFHPLKVEQFLKHEMKLAADVTMQKPKFTDDTLTSIEGRDWNSLIGHMNIFLGRVNLYVNKNILKLNVTKTRAMLFSTSNRLALVDFSSLNLTIINEDIDFVHEFNI